MKITNINTKCQNCKDFMDRLLKEQVESLKEEKMVLEKALKLVCGYYHSESCSNCGCDEHCSSCTNRTAETLEKYILKEAKELMKSE